MLPKRCALSCVLVLLSILSVGLASAQSYTSIVIIGDSLSDTGNDATVSASTPTAGVPVPAPATGYTQGRFTDGRDTMPAAMNYLGVWIEQLAAKLPAKPTINYSLNGGSNYAYGFATTGTGTTAFTYGPGNVLVFPVNNMGLQLSTYLQTAPTITNKTLFVVWGGANDLISAVTAADIQNAAAREAGIVQTLITAGATDIIVPNLPPLGAVPRFNGTAATSVPATTAAAGFNQYLAAYLSGIPPANPTKTLHLYTLDIYTLFNTILAAPANYGFANVTAMSQGASVNPDTYLFWDNLHPTTYGHSLIANAALTLMNGPIATTTTLTSSTANANLGANLTLTATVVAASGTTAPVGYVSFADGNTVLGSSLVTGKSTSGTATLTLNTLLAGTHNITATFSGVNGFGGSMTTTSLSQIVTAPAVSSGFSSSSITIARGSGGSAQLIITPVGGYTGIATVSCGVVPAKLICNPVPPTVPLSGNVPATVTLYFDTTTASTMARPPSFEHTGILAAFAMLPCFGFAGFAASRRRRNGKSIAMPTLLMLVFGMAMLGTAGCGSSTDTTSVATGSYTLNVTATVNGTVINNPLTVVVQ